MVISPSRREAHADGAFEVAEYLFHGMKVLN
jgi:hypothetical protein